jgi:hypothetical protein
VNLQYIDLSHNKLTSLPVEILNIKAIMLDNLYHQAIMLDDTSYNINNISNDTEMLIFLNLNKNLENLPLTLKTLYLHKRIDLTKYTIKLPFSCVIERF